MEATVSRLVGRQRRIAELAAPILARHPVVRAFLFGSQARGDQGEGSDVDLYCSIDRTRPFGLFALGSLVRDLEQALGMPVDVITADDVSLTNPRLNAEIERDKVLLYERSPER